MRVFVYSLLLNILFAGATFPGLENWYHPHRMALTGAGGAIQNITADAVNPAALWMLPRQFEVSFISYPADITAQSVHLSLPGKESVTVYGLRHLNYGLFSGRDELNQETENYSATDTWLNWAAAGHSSRWPLAWGLSAGVFYSTIEDEQAALFTFSAGAIVDLKKLNSKLGVSLINSGSVIKNYSENEEELPTAIVISISKKLAYLPLTFSLDAYNRFSTKMPEMRLGGVFALPYGLQLKLGTSTNRLQQSTGQSLSGDFFADTGLGVGWIYENYNFETGVYSYGSGGWISGLAVGIMF